MRAVKVSVAPEHKDEVITLLWRTGISSATVHEIQHVSSSGKSETRSMIDVETSTPKAKQFTDELARAPFFDRERISVSTRQPRSIVSDLKRVEATRPWVEPGEDICQELWQFSHLTTGYAGRVLIAGGLLAYGIINQHLLLMIAGMMFLPSLPIIMAIGVGAWTREWKMALRAAATLLAGLGLLVVSGLAVAAVSSGPVKYDDFVSIPVSLTISVAVGIASALANTDDGGRREMIGLAAAAQIAVIPVWFGVCIILGFPASESSSDILMRAVNLLANILMILVFSLATYLALGALSAPGRHTTELS